MITLQSTIHVNQLRGIDIFNFLMNPNDRDYQDWWPGTHLAFHKLSHNPYEVYMDEYIGRRRVQMTGIVTEAKPGKKIVWQMKKLFRLPVLVSLELKDDSKGVTITHTITAGYTGIGSLLDVFLRVYFSDAFGNAMDEHFRAEFPMLRNMLLARESIP